MKTDLDLKFNTFLETLNRFYDSREEMDSSVHKALVGWVVAHGQTYGYPNDTESILDYVVEILTVHTKKIRIGSKYIQASQDIIY
jgi:hypothetical protein